MHNFIETAEDETTATARSWEKNVVSHHDLGQKFT